MLKYKADYKTLFFMFITTLTFGVQWYLGTIYWPVYVFYLYLSIGISVIAHNQNHWPRNEAGTNHAGLDGSLAFKLLGQFVFDVRQAEPPGEFANDFFRPIFASAAFLRLEQKALFIDREPKLPLTVHGSLFTVFHSGTSESVRVPPARSGERTCHR